MLPDRGSNWRMVLRRDGKIIISGLVPAGGGAPERALLICLNTRGGIEPRFGKDGRVTYAAPKRNFVPLASTIQSDGKILLAGWDYAATTSYSKCVAVVRLDTAGNVDATFGKAGRTATPIKSVTSGYAIDLVLRSTGDILVACNDLHGLKMMLLSGK
jgi:uncharacterized delta-60 repeat protein